MVLVAVALLALIGSAALILLAGSVVWQKDQLQELADATALDSALQIGVGCDGITANAVIKEADDFLATRRTKTGVLAVPPATCATTYSGTDTFSGGLTATYNYPFRKHQKQVEVILKLALPISFGGEVGVAQTTVTRRAVAQALAGSMPAVSATALTCASGQVNVGGDVMTQNAIAIGGTCALYAHARLDAASGTYTNFGNVQVYADGQGWGGGACVANATSGSATAICADGSEVSGHINPACGPGGTRQFLSAADAVLNPNPCAAGKARLPVFARVTTQPPEPNTDPAAIARLQGTGGAPCLPGGVYPNITVNGVVVGTGLGPPPVKDASGYYHFKPSCYGYLNPAALAGGISNVQIGPKSAVTTPTVTPTLPFASQPGTLLVADIRSGPSGVAFTAPAGWARANSINQAGASRTEIWYYRNNPGGISNAAFGVPNAAIAQMTEWRNVIAAAPLDRTGTVAVNSNQLSATVMTAAATTQADELVITDFGPGVKALQTYTPAAGWNSLVSDMPDGFAAEYRIDLPAAIARETVTVTKPTEWSAVIATFKGGGAAVLDPGFYYFNSSGFPTGGGICLNGGMMLARDVTLEFVNRAGFSSGTCTAGGGAACVGACQFGSAPCSLQVCPPNVAADGLNNLTWFSAPCSAAPAADAASCPGSTWCPAGDKACQNLLIWAPVGSTGQIAMTGAAVRDWLLGSISWPGTCTYAINGRSSIFGSVACGTLSISAAVGAGIGLGSDYGVNTATVEAVLIE